MSLPFNRTVALFIPAFVMACGVPHTPAVPTRVLPVPVALTNSIDMRFVRIPSGDFTMGSPAEEAHRFLHEGPAHKVTIGRPYWLGVYEVTQGQFKKVMGTNPARFAVGDDHPVEQVTWEQAVEFCAKLSALPDEKAARRTYRLPTEAEWEYAARAGSTTPYGTGETLGAQDANCDQARPKTAPVGSGKANAWKLHDMHGNVWEWCADWFEPNTYTEDGATDPVGPEEGSARVIRGGSWNTPADRCRSAAREAFSPANRFNDIGFRVVCETK